MAKTRVGRRDGSQSVGNGLALTLCTDERIILTNTIHIDIEMLSHLESEPVLRRLLSLSPGAKEFAANMMKKYLNR